MRGWGIRFFQRAFRMGLRFWLSAGLLGSRLGQSTVSALPWAGQASCTLNAQQDGYAHQEIQTWTITGTAPRADSNMPVYDAMWSSAVRGRRRELGGCKPFPRRGTGLGLR